MVINKFTFTPYLLDLDPFDLTCFVKLNRSLHVT